MPQITSIETQRRGGRVTIFVDGAPWLAVHRSVALDHGLRRGDQAGDALRLELQAADQRVSAYESALLLLSYRMRSSAELRERLSRKGFLPDQVDAALVRLAAAGLIDDEDFARRWVEERGQGKAAHGSRRLRADLRRKGVPTELIEQAIETVPSGEAVMAVAAARARGLAALEYPDFRRKLGAFLARRGYGYEESAHAVREAWLLVHEENPDQSDE